MIGQTISHYKILEKLYQKNGRQLNEGGLSSLIQDRDKSVLLVGGVAYETGDRE